MDIFSFSVHFTDESSCRLHFKELRDKEGVVCNRCGALRIIGLKTNGRTNASPVRLDKPCAVEQYWKTQIYLFWFGIRRFV